MDRVVRPWEGPRSHWFQNPTFPPPSIVDVAALQQRFTDVFYPLPGRTSLMEHHFDMQPGVMVHSWPYRLPEHKRQVVQWE